VKDYESCEAESHPLPATNNSVRTGKRKKGRRSEKREIMRSKYEALRALSSGSFGN
jgi:hypothetical protein